MAMILGVYVWFGCSAMAGVLVFDEAGERSAVSPRRRVFHGSRALVAVPATRPLLMLWTAPATGI